MSIVSSRACLTFLRSTAFILALVRLARAESFIGTHGAKDDAPVVPLVTGCGRAGTHTAGELILSLGIKAVHEGSAMDAVAVSWFYGTDDSFKKSDEVPNVLDALCVSYGCLRYAKSPVDACGHLYESSLILVHHAFIRIQMRTCGVSFYT